MTTDIDQLVETLRDDLALVRRSVLTRWKIDGDIEACDRMSAALGTLREEIERLREEAAFRDEQSRDRYRDRNKARNQVNTLADENTDLRAQLERQEAGIDFEKLRMDSRWPTPNAMRQAADGLDSFTLARYGDVLRWMADACDGILSAPPNQEEPETPSVWNAVSKLAEQQQVERQKNQAERDELNEALDNVLLGEKREMVRLRAERDRYEAALREIADYRNNDAQLRALRIARAALSTSPNQEEE